MLNPAFFEKNKQIVVPFVVTSLALFLYHLLGVRDFWGDAFHNVFISKATFENDWVYSDYKLRHLVWLPAYRYFITIFMAAFGSFSLETAYLVNGFLAAISASLVGSLVAEYRGKTLGMWAGMYLGTLGWFIAYSHMNMPETSSAILLLLAVFLCHRKLHYWLFPVSFLIALSRNEVTLLLFILWIFLVIHKEWKPVLIIAFGVGSALILWATWCWYMTGNPLYWLEIHIKGSSYDSSFNAPPRNIILPTISLLLAFPGAIFLPIFAYLKLKKESFSALPNIFKISILIAVLHWIFIIITQFWFYSYPDPRYFLISLPLSVIALFSVFEKIRWLNIVLITTTFLFLVGNVIRFIGSGHGFDHRQDLGAFIAENVVLNDNEMIITDSPEVWYYAGQIPIKQVGSSDLLAPQPIREDDDVDEQIGQIIRQNNIKFVVWFEASFSHTHLIWPEMKTADTIEWQGLKFTKLFKNPHVEPNTDGSYFDLLISTVKSRSIEMSLWRIDQIE